MKLKFSSKQIAFSLFVVTASSFLTWQSVRAYVILGRWGVNNVRYGFDLSVPPLYQPAINRSANTWTDVTPSSWTWTYDPYNGYLVRQAYLDGSGSQAAVTSLGIIASTILWMEIKIDYENWYTGTGIPAGNQIDLQSAITHEFGHGLGLDHTTQTYCRGNTNDATMCPVLFSGQFHWRTLEGDDRNGVNALYP